MPRKSSKPSRKRTKRGKPKLAPPREKRGLEAEDVVLSLDAPEVSSLARELENRGGKPLVAYREPLSGRPLLLAVLPLEAVEPTPFQRDLSPAHAKKLAQKISESGSFLDPVIVVRGADGTLWTPNGRHRLAAAKVLGLRYVTALVSPDESLAFRILALNTEKAHNLKERSLEVIRMARELAKRQPRSKESEHAEEFESPELLTLGLAYEEDPRFAGGAYAPVLRKVDRFSDETLPASLRRREGLAARLLQVDSEVKRVVEALRKRGFRSPYLRNFVVARIQPLPRARGRKKAPPPMGLAELLTRMAAAARSFDVSSVHPGELALVAAVAPEPAE
ncbi:MAG: hypothetical protein KatS3mg076_2745 [Candidatus Binatia bacterium]|nr:MAG: hypothetical protein KatS3mg076_2745 [Candidatus Binatia bacterium]